MIRAQASATTPRRRLVVLHETDEFLSHCALDGSVHQDARLQAYEKNLLGDPVRDRSIYEASSPFKYIRNAKAPLLVLLGDNDIRVPKEEAEQVVALLKGEGRTV